MSLLSRRLPRALILALGLTAAQLPDQGDRNPAALVEAARTAAREDRNREAANLFSRAIAADPTLRDQLLRELADQLTYSDRSSEAVPLYREVLARTGLQAEERRRAERGLALALSWSGRHSEAVEAYDRILAAEPEDMEARLNRARVNIWRGAYGAAESDYRQVLGRQPTNGAALRGLAEAQSFRGHQRDALATLDRVEEEDADTLLLRARTQNWAGRPDRAQESIDRTLAVRPEDRSALALREEIRTARRPQLALSASHSDQSDATDFTRLSGWQRFFPSGPLNMVGAGYELFLFRQQGGVDIDVHRPAAQARLRYADWGELNAEIGVNIEREPDQTDHILTYSLSTTIQPSDRLRFDVGTSRQTLDNVRSMLRDITATSYGGSVDIGSDAGLRASLRGSYTGFSDGNERLWGQAELRQRLTWRPNGFVGLRYTRFGFSERFDNGYFNPDRLQAIEATAQVWGRAGRFYYDLRGSVGREDAVPGGARTIYAAEARLTHLLTDQLEIEGYVSTFSSRIDTPGGFSRTTGGIALRLRW